MTEKEIIAKAYDAGAYQEYRRLAETVLGETEFSLIKELLSEYIAIGSTIVDIGAGPGRYAEFLLARNCIVGAVDLSQGSLDMFEKRINGNFINHILFSKKSCATELEWIESSIADAVLLMGPMYHLTSEKDRIKAIDHAFRILKPGGIIFAVFMSPYPKLNPLMESNIEMLFDQSYINSIQNNGVTKVLFQGYEINQFRCWPIDAKIIMEKQGFITERMLNIEGIGDFLSKFKENQFNNNEKKLLLKTIRSTCENPNLLGITSQYLYLGKK
jgi:ubiquinone/menaquinone biosynthesis C-methylase UbiE